MVDWTDSWNEHLRTVQVETQSTGSFILMKNFVTLGLDFLGKSSKSCLKLKFEVLSELSYKILPKN